MTTTLDHAVASTRGRFIAIEGPIGVGKTSLARRLATTLHTELLLEAAEANPFLPRFYYDPRRYALATQLHFLFDRVRQLKPRAQADLFEPALVSDFLFDKDRLFARVALEPAEFELYEQVYARVMHDLPTPDLVIYLQASVPVLQNRIARRGVDYEQNIAGNYLERLCAEYVDYFYYFDAAPLLIVNAEEVNLVDNERHYTDLLAHIARGVAGRQYFNPSVE